MGIVVADRTVDLAEQGNFRDLFFLALQSCDDIRHLLADGRWRSRLSMGTREHRKGGVLMRHCTDCIDYLLQFGQKHTVAAVTQHECMAEVVDIFRGTGEMDEFIDGLELGSSGDFLLEKIFDRLDVVIGGALDLFYAFCVTGSEVADDLFQLLVRLRAEGRNFDDLRIGSKCLEPADLDNHPVANESVFTENLPEGFRLAAVASIDRGDGCERRELHSAGPGIEKKRSISPVNAVPVFLILFTLNPSA